MRAPRTRRAAAGIVLACLGGAVGAASDDVRVLQLPPRDAPAERAAVVRAAWGDPQVEVLWAWRPDRLVVRAPPAAAPPRGSTWTPLLPELRLAPGAHEHDGAFVVHPGPGTRASDLAARLVSLAAGRRPAVATAGDRLVVLGPGASRALLEQAAALPDVLAVLPVHALEAAGVESRALLQGGVDGPEPLFALGVAGQGEIVAVADSGLSVGCAFEDAGVAPALELVDPAAPPDPPLTSPSHRKVQAYQRWSVTDFDDEPDSDLVGYHGTAVSGVVAGDRPPVPEVVPLHPDAPPARVRAGPVDGQAPGARLVVQDLHVAGGDYLVPTDLAGLVTAAQRAGAAVWNASWTERGAPLGAYTHFARELDVAAARHPDLTIVVACGNRAAVIPGSVKAPSTARNVIAVGNAGTGIFREDLAPTSTWGPTADGRRKPDLVAPGSGIVTADGGAPCASVQSSGTSLAAPAVAAAAALVRQYLREGREVGGLAGGSPGRVPSSALVRAVLVAATRALTGGPEPTVDEGPTPSPEQGWGRLVLTDVLPTPDGERTLVVLDDDDLGSPDDGFPPGEMTPRERELTVLPGPEPLVVVLVWTDAPPAPMAATPVVNDLDLEVESPSGALFHGNVLSEGWSVPGGAADPLDVPEVVRIEPPVEAGVWTVRVVPRDVLVGPQPYALVAAGRACAAAPAFAGPTVVAEASCGVLSVSAPTLAATSPVTYSLYRADAPGGQDFGAPLASGLRRPRWLDTPPTPGPWHYVFAADDGCRARALAAEASAEIADPCAVGTPSLRVRRLGPGDVLLSWTDGAVPRDVRRHAVPWIVRGAAPVATSDTGDHVEPLPTGSLTAWVVD